MQGMQSIVFDSVHKVFRRGGFFLPRRKQIETHALKDVSIQVTPGEILALLGPNGSGKTTTLRLVSTMLLPDAGRVVVNGADTRSQARMARRNVGFAVAAERSFFPRLTARENLKFFAALEDVPRRERHSRVREVLCDVGLEHAAEKQVMKFSSGMHQRLGIARALVKQPSVLLLDEPTRSLDPAAAQSLWTLVRQLSQSGMTIIIATHNFGEAIAVADRVAILQLGELLAMRHVAGLSVEQLRRFYLQTTGEPEHWLEEVPA
jgi:ABC-2 type transport system ATP-binding protein